MFIRYNMITIIGDPKVEADPNLIRQDLTKRFEQVSETMNVHELEMRRLEDNVTLLKAKAENIRIQIAIELQNQPRNRPKR